MSVRCMEQPPRLPGVRGGPVLLGVILLLAAGFMFWSSPAKADDGSLTMTLDTSVMNLGSTTGVKVIDPAAVPPDPPATLNATLTDTGDVSTPAAGFSFPTKIIEDLDAGGFTVDAKIEISATTTITGTFDSATGATGIAVPAQALISVSLANTTDPLGICRVSGFTLGLSSTGVLQDPGVPGADPPHPPHDYDAAPFAPPTGDGAMVATWTGLPASVAEGGSLPDAVCPAVDDLVGGPGGIWLSGTAIPSGEPVVLPPSKAPLLDTYPTPVSNSTEAEFEYREGTGEDQEVNRFQCRIDSASSDDWETCGTGSTAGSKEYTGLTPGDHMFEVRAGNDTGYGPASSYEWTIIAAPAVAPKLLASPPPSGESTSADFTFEKGAGETQPVDRFECRLDSSGTWTACDSGSRSYSNLAVGDHKFEVRAGNATGYGPVTTHTWKVTAVTPPPPPDPTCAEDPAQAKCQARLGKLKVTPKVKKVKRGKKVTFKVRVTNTGDGIARKVKLCLKGPKKLVKRAGPACRTVASMAPGKTAKVTLKMKVTRKAKPGKKAKVTVKASGQGLKALRTKATVKFKK